MDYMFRGKHVNNASYHQNAFSPLFIKPLGALALWLQRCVNCNMAELNFDTKIKNAAKRTRQHAGEKYRKAEYVQRRAPCVLRQ